MAIAAWCCAVSSMRATVRWSCMGWPVLMRSLGGGVNLDTVDSNFAVEDEATSSPIYGTGLVLLKVSRATPSDSIHCATEHLHGTCMATWHAATETFQPHLDTNIVEADCGCRRAAGDISVMQSLTLVEKTDAGYTTAAASLRRICPGLRLIIGQPANSQELKFGNAKSIADATQYGSS